MIDNTFFIESLKGAAADTANIAPFLLFIFILTGAIEFFYFDKISSFARYSKYTGPLIGSLIASFPQCGFSVIASTLYIRGFITKGTLLAVYLSTSDEAIPVLLSDPSEYKVVIPIICTKIVIGVTAGYLIDFIFKTKKTSSCSSVLFDKGCCSHNICKPSFKDLLIHPFVHTLNVLLFVFIVTLVLNLVLNYAGAHENSSIIFLQNSLFQPVFTALFGLIPNCAVSMAITLMYIKGILSFGSVIAGLCSGAGLGILVLIKNNNNRKDTLSVISLLFIISVAAGFLFESLKF